MPQGFFEKEFGRSVLIQFHNSGAPVKRPITDYLYEAARIRALPPLGHTS